MSPEELGGRLEEAARVRSLSALGSGAFVHYLCHRLRRDNRPGE